MISVDELIRINSKDFDSWIVSINNFLDYRYSENELQTNKLWEVTSSCVNSLSKIAELCIRFGNYKDNWDYNNFYQHLYGPELIIKSSKTSCEFKIGLDNKGIYLSTDFRYNENLRYMGDEFWKLLLSLYEFDGFIYEEFEFVNDTRRKQFPELFSTNKSMVFRILRKYIFDSTETDNRYVSSSVGELRIQWPSDTDFEEIIRNCCLGFKVMYQLNYSLWKVTDLKTRKTFANKG